MLSKVCSAAVDGIGAVLVEVKVNERYGGTFLVMFSCTLQWSIRSRCRILPSSLDPVRLARQENEDSLRNLLGKVWVTRQPQGRRMHQIDVAGHERGKRPFGVVPDIKATSLSSAL